MLANISTADIEAVKSMTRAERDALEERIKTVDPHSVFRAAGETRHANKRKIICPICGNGTGDSKTPVEAERKDGGVWLYNCFKCGDFHGNLFGIIADDAHLTPKGNFDDTCKVLAIGANLIGYPLPAAQDVKPKPTVDDADKEKREERLKKINAVIADAQNNLPDFVKACGGTWRGLTGRTLSHFSCGYLSDWHHSKKLSTSPRVIIPAETAPSTANYLARLTIPIEDVPADDRKWIQEKEHDGAKTLFNRDAAKSRRVIVVEGYIDAMSIFQAFDEKIAVVALGGKNGGDLLLNAVKTLRQKPKTIILFDADATEQAENLRGILVDNGVPAVSKVFDDFVSDDDKQIIGGKIDANAILVKLGAEKLKAYTNAIIDSAEGKAIALDAGRTAKVQFGRDLSQNTDDLSFGDSDSISQKTSRQERTGSMESQNDSILYFKPKLRGEKGKKHEKAQNDSTREETFADVEEKIAADAALMKRLDDWQKRNGKIQPKTLDDLKTAIQSLNSVTPDNITAAFANSNENLTNVALAQAFDFYDEAEKFFVAIKAAKENAKNRMKEADKLTAPLTQDELVALSALVEGVNVKRLRERVDREANDIYRMHKVLWRAESGRIEAEKAEQEYQKRREAAIAAEEKNKDRIQQLKEMEPSPERDAELIALISGCCEWRKDRHGDPYAVKATQANAELIFGNDPDLDGLFGFDEFQQADVFLRPAPWKKKAKKGDEWTDRDDAQLRSMIRGRYTEFANKELIADNITKFSDARAFHEVKEFFKSLPKWDGVKRAETLFIDYLKADDTPYVREVTLNWLTAAVCRIFYPGCDYQIAPILLGKQGIGKSHIIRRLFGKWYIVLSDAVDDPHAIDAIQKGWGIEVKEMAAMKKDVDANKRFIDTAEDTRRFAYDRRARKIKRHCVFIITSNNQQLLSDLTGNRRYPVIACHATQHGAEITDDYIKQLWAEVLAHCKELFKDGFDEHKLELSDETKKIVGEVAEQYLNDNGMTGAVAAFLDMKILPPVIWNLLSKEQRRQFVVDGGVFVIDESDLVAKFKASRKNIPADLQAEFDAAVKSSDAVVYKDGRNKLTGEITTHIAFYGTEYRQHICAAEVKAERFDKTDRRATTQAISEILADVTGWHKEVKKFRDTVYGEQKRVYYRDADNVPADDAPPTEPPANDTATPSTATPDTPTVALEREKVDEPEFDMSQWDD